MTQDKFTNVVDVTIDTPEGAYPPKIRLLLNRNVIKMAEQYKDALFVSRHIPFNMNAIPISDPIAMIVGTQYHISGNEAVMQAQNWYSEWAAEAEREAYTLAMLADPMNVFTNEPLPYPPQENPPPGIPFIPKPQRNLSIPVERRLKQIIDILNLDPMFESKVMSAINNAFLEAARLAVTDAAGFRSGSTDSDVPAQDESSGGAK